MKIAISIPQDVFALAERSAKRLGISRSEFFARAAAALARQVEHADITARINAVLAKTTSPIDPELSKMQARVLEDEKW